MTWCLENTRMVLTEHQHLSLLLSAAVGGAYLLRSCDRPQGSNPVGDNGHPSWRAALSAKLARPGGVGSPGQQRAGHPGDRSEWPQWRIARSCNVSQTSPPPPAPPQWPSETPPAAQASRESGLGAVPVAGRRGEIQGARLERATQSATEAPYRAGL